MAYTSYGPGDSATWGPNMGHPLDPRNDDIDCDSTDCPECNDGSCKECVDLFIRDFEPCIHATDWLIEQGCEPYGRIVGDDDIDEVLRHMAGQYKQGIATGNAFWRIMQSFSIQAAAHQEFTKKKRVTA